MSSRIHRGFHRIGVVLAVPPLLLAGWLAGHEAWTQWAASAHAPASTSARSVGIEDPFAPYLKSAPAKYSPFDDLLATMPEPKADYTGALISLALSVILYAAARAVGWILAGFIGSDGTPSP